MRGAFTLRMNAFLSVICGNMRLEVISKDAVESQHPTPLLFIHSGVQGPPFQHD
jgi:hypothetical protein